MLSANTNDARSRTIIYQHTESTMKLLYVWISFCWHAQICCWGCLISKPKVGCLMLTQMAPRRCCQQVEHVRLGIPISTPLAVQQWDGIIAVNYAARKFGVRRGDRADATLKKCPQIKLVHVETISAESASVDGGGGDGGGGVDEASDAAVAGASRALRDKGACKVSLERFVCARCSQQYVERNTPCDIAWCPKVFRCILVTKTDSRSAKGQDGEVDVVVGLDQLGATEALVYWCIISAPKTGGNFVFPVLLIFLDHNATV